MQGIAATLPSCASRSEKKGGKMSHLTHFSGAAGLSAWLRATLVSWALCSCPVEALLPGRLPGRLPGCQLVCPAPLSPYLAGRDALIVCNVLVPLFAPFSTSPPGERPMTAP